MSNEDSKKRLLNILKWLEDYQGSKSQSDPPSLSIDLGNSSSHGGQSANNKLKQCKSNPAWKNPCRDSPPAIGKSCENMNTSSSSSTSDTRMYDEKFNCTLANDSNTCELKHFSVMGTDSRQINANTKLGLELSDVQNANTSAWPKEKDKSSSRTFSANGDLLQDNADEISENLQFAAAASSTAAAVSTAAAAAGSGDGDDGTAGGGEDVAEESIAVSYVEGKTLEDPLKSPDDESQMISKSKSVLTKQNDKESIASIFEQDFGVSKTLEKQSQEKVVTEVDSDKIPTEQTCHSENSNEILSGVSGHLFPRIGKVCPQATSDTPSHSTGINDPLINGSDKSKQYDSPQLLIQPKYSVTPENKHISSNLDPNDNPQTVSNYKNTNTQYLGKTLNVQSDSVRNSSSDSKPSTSSIVEETQEVTIKSSQIHDKSLKEDCCTLSSSVNSTDGNKAPDQNALLDSDEVMIKHQEQTNDKFVKTRPNFRDKEENPEKHLNKFSTMNTAMNASLNLSNPAGEEADIYRTRNMSNYPSAYNSSLFKSSFINPRPCSSNDDRRQIPEQCYQECQPLYFANMSMNKSSDIQYIFYPNSINSQSSSLCYSPGFQYNSVSNYIGKSNDGLATSSNIFSNHQRTNFKPFSSPYMVCLQNTPSVTSVNDEKSNINGIRGFIENCQSLQNSYVNVPEMSNQDQYTVLQNAVLTSPQQRQQQLYPNMYNKGNQSDYLVYKTNRLAHNSNKCIKNFNQFTSSQEFYSQIDNSTVKYPSNPHNPDFFQTKPLTNARSIQCPTADSSAQNMSHPISNVRTDNVTSPKQYLTQDNLQPRMEPLSQHSSINERFDSNIQNEIKSHAGIDIYNKTTGCSVNPLQDSEINRNSSGYLKPNNYIQFHSTSNNTFRNPFNNGINSGNSLPQFHQRHYNSEVIHPDNFRDIMAWIPKPSRNVPCDPTKVINKEMGNTAKILHQVQPQKFSNLSMSEIKKNGYISENSQYLQNQMYNISQPLLSQNMGHHQNLASGVSSSIFKLQHPVRYTQPPVSSEHNATETSTETMQNEITQCFHTSIRTPVDCSGSRINYFGSEYSSGLNGQADNNFQAINVNEASNARQIQDSKQCRAENVLQELTESNFCFLDNGYLKESSNDEGKSLSGFNGKYDGSKNGQSSDMMSDESFLFSDYDPVFLANLLTNDFDSFNDYNSAFDEGFEDAASVTMTNSVQTENDFIENIVSSFESDTRNPDNIMVLQNSDNNQHINLSNIQASSDTSISVTNDDQKSNFHYDNQMKYSTYPNNSLGSFTRKPVCTSQCATTQGRIIRQRYPSKTATYQCTPGQTIYAADMVPRIDINPHASKRRNRSTGSVRGSSAVVLKEKKNFSYDPEVTKRFSDRCASKTAYQLAESISECEINRGRCVKKSRISKENSFKNDNGSKTKIDDTSSMSLSVDNGGFSNRYTDYVNERSTEIQSPNTGIPSKSVTSNVEKVQYKTKNVKEVPRRPRGRPRLSEEVKRERAMKRALQAKFAPRTRIKNSAKMNGKEQTVQQICTPTNKNFSSETDLNLSDDSQQHRSEAANNKASQVHSDTIIVTHDSGHSENIENPGSSAFNEQAKEENNENEAALPTPNLSMDLSRTPLQLTNEKHLKENGENVSKMESKENGWFDEGSNLSQEERQMKSYLELKKKLDKRQKTNKAPWKCPYLQSKTENEESRRKFSKRKSVLNYYGSTKKWYSERNYTNSKKTTDTNEDSMHGLNSSCSTAEMQEKLKLALPAEDKMSPTSNNLNSNETMSASNRNELSSMELHGISVSEQTKHQKISKTLSDLANKRQLSSRSSVRQKPPLSEKQNRSRNLSHNYKNKSSSPIAMIHPCIPLPIYPPPPPPLFRLPPPPPLREKKVTPRNVNPTIVENARLCYEAIKHQLSKAESDFDSFLISYANIVQGLQHCGAERYRRIKEILLKTSEMKVTIGDNTSSENKGVEQSLVTAEISENGGETKGMTRERSTNKVLSDIDALSIQGDSSVNDKPLDRNEFTDDYTELVKIILTSRADEYRNIKLVISRNICGGTDMKQIVNKNTNQAELEAKKAKLAAYFENVGKMVMMEEKFSNKLTKSRGAGRKRRKRSIKKSLGSQKEKTSNFLANLNSDEIEGQTYRRDIASNRKKSDLEEKADVDHVPDTKVCDRKYTLSADKLKKNRVGRPRKNTTREIPGVLNRQCSKKQEEQYSEKDEYVVELSSSSDGGFVEESTGDYILGLGTESDDDILFNSVKFQTYFSENDTKCPVEEEKSDLKENSVTENFSNFVTPTTEICKQLELKGIIPDSPASALTDGTDEIECSNSKLSPRKLNTKVSSRQSMTNRNRRKVRYDLSSVDGKSSKTDIQTDPTAKEYVSFKIRNQSKIIKPKTAVIPKEIRQRKLVKYSQKVRQSKLQRNAKKIDDKPVKDSHRMKDNTNICENNAKPTIIRDTKNERKALKNVNPIESCADEDIDLTYVDSDTEMFDTSNIDSVKSWKVKKENRKLKRKHSQINNSIISTKYFNSLSTRPLESDNSSESYFQNQNAQKRNMSFKDYIPKIGNNLTSDDDKWMMEEVLRPDSKEISTDADENTPRAKYKRNKRTDIEGSRNIDLSVPDLKVTTESSEHSKNCISNFGKSSNKSNESKDSMNLKFVQKSSKSGPHAKRNYNRTLQRENIKDVSVTKVTNSTGVLNISEMENVASFIENTVDHKIKDDKTNIVCQNQSTNDHGAKHSRLSSKLTPESKKTNSRKGEVLKIQSINFEKEPLLIKTATLLKEEESFKTIHETKNIFDMLYQTAGTAGNETSLTNQTESMDGLESSSSNCRNGQYSKSDVNLLKVWDSKSSKFPVLPNRLKTTRLNADNDRKTLVVNCCRLENNLSNSYSLQSSECTGSITKSDTKMKPNFACRGILKDNYVSPEDRRINKKVCFSLDNDEEEASSRKNRNLKIRVNESNYKDRDSKTISAVKTSKSGRISKKLFNTNEEFTHKNSRIKKSDSSTRTSTSKNLDFHEGIIHVDVVSHVDVSDASSNDNKSTSKVNHSNTKRTSRRQKKRPPLICEYCSKLFTKPSQLLYHTRSHTGERPFKCDVCDKAFVSNSHLLRHSRTHLSVKSHICDTCGRGFSQRYSLMTHENTHSGFKCQKCSVTFRTRESLVKHERKHYQHQIRNPKTKVT